MPVFFSWALPVVAYSSTSGFSACCWRPRFRWSLLGFSCLRLRFASSCFIAGLSVCACSGGGPSVWCPWPCGLLLRIPVLPASCFLCPGLVLGSARGLRLVSLLLSLRVARDNLLVVGGFPFLCSRHCLLVASLRSSAVGFPASRFVLRAPFSSVLLQLVVSLLSVSHVLCLSGSSPGCVFLLCCGGVLVLGCGCFRPCPFLPRFSCFGAPSSPLWCPSVGFGCQRVPRLVQVVPWVGCSVAFLSFSRMSSGSALLHPWG